MKTIKLLAVCILITMIGCYGFIQTGMFDVSAKAEDGPFLTWLLHTTMEKSVEKHAEGIEIPDLNKKEMVLAGASDYVAMCAQCHGEPGKPPGIIQKGLNPTPPDLHHLADTWKATEKFWIISNGIRMTGMPSFSKSHGPGEIWPVVAFLQSARNITPDEYSRLKAESKDFGHHTNSEGNNNHGSHTHDLPDKDTLESNVGPEHHHEQGEMGHSH